MREAMASREVIGKGCPCVCMTQLQQQNVSRSALSTFYDKRKVWGNKNNLKNLDIKRTWQLE